MSKEKLTKIELKLRKPHPRQVMQLGKHAVTAVFASYELNSSELKELQGKGCKAWMISKEEFDSAKKEAPAKKKD